MKHLSLLKNLAMACGTLAAAVVFSSCSSTISPGLAADKLDTCVSASVFSHNDANNPNYRECREAGPLPGRALRAIQSWLRSSTVKNFAYAYPQYFVTLNEGNGRERVWALCSDGQGNLVGILIPRTGVKAWDLPPVGNYRVYVCDTPRRKALSDAIMNTLAEAGYDSFRIDTRKAMGLTQQRYLISKPLSDEAQKRYDAIKKQEERIQQGKTDKDDEDTATPAPSASGDDDLGIDSDDTDSGSTDDTDSSDDSSDSGDSDDSSDDSGFDELGF